MLNDNMKYDISDFSSNLCNVFIYSNKIDCGFVPSFGNQNLK